MLQMERPEVFYTCEWALSMQRAYASSLNPLLVLQYDGDLLVGVASLAIESDTKQIVFLAGNTADYCEFLSAPESRGRFVEAVLGELKGRKARFMAFANLPSDSATPASLRSGAKKNGLHLFLRPAYTCAQVQLGNGDARAALCTEIARKQMLRRKLRALEQQGVVRYAHLSSWDQIAPLMQGFADTHAAYFQASGRISSLATQERRDFLNDLARRFSGSGGVTLSVLMLDGKAIAWNYGFRFHASWFWYQPAFSRAWEKFSPGYCLLARIIADACADEGLDLIDLGLGDEGYKERFANAARQTLHATVTSSVAQHYRQAARYKAAQALKRFPSLEAAMRRILRRAS